MVGAAAESSEAPGVIALYATSVPTSSETLTLLDYLPPLAFIAVALVIVLSVVRSSFNQESGLPNVRAHWKEGNDLAITVEIESKRRRIAIEGCEAVAPWTMRGGVKRSIIEPDSFLSFDVRFKKQHHQPLLVLLKMEVDTLGGWTQNIRLPVRSEVERSVENERP